MNEILSGKAVAYARWCLPEENRKVPHYVRLQARQWLDIVEGRNPEARIDEGKYRKICKLLRVMNHPDLGCSLYDGLEDYALCWRSQEKTSRLSTVPSSLCC